MAAFKINKWFPICKERTDSMYLNFFLKVQCIFAQSRNMSDQNRDWSKCCKLGVKKEKKEEPVVTQQATHENLTHVRSEHPELPMKSEVVIYLSHPFGQCR